MILKNILRNLILYKIHIFKILIFEIIYFIKGYKGNKFRASKDEIINDNIPCPYYFLHHIKKLLLKEDFNTFVDFGCGSGRAIDFFNKNFPNKNFVGIEYYDANIEHCKKYFKNKKNIKLVHNDFLKYDFRQDNPDCYFFNEPISDYQTLYDVLKKIVYENSKKNKILLIFVNCDIKNFEILKKTTCIEKYEISDRKGYSIYCINK